MNSHPVFASYVSGSGTSSLRFSYTISNSDAEDRLDYFDADALLIGTSTVQDLRGNPAILTLPNPGCVGSLANPGNIKVNYTVTIVGVIPPLPRRYYRDELLEFV